MYQLAIFDFDGTIADSVFVWHEVDHVFLNKRGLLCDQSYLTAVRNLPFLEAAKFTVEHYQLKEDPEEILQEWFGLAKHAYTYDVKLKNGVYEYLKHLRNHGIKLGLATASTKQLCMPTLNRYEIVDWFDCIVTGDEIKKSKAFPDIYLAVANQLNVQPQNAVVFEDISMGIITANKAGFNTVGILDPLEKEEWSEIKKNAKWCYYSFHNLLYFPPNFDK